MRIDDTICIEKNGLCKIGELFDLNHKIMIITDNGVPQQYVQTIKKQCKEAVIYYLSVGEESKSLAVLEKVMQVLMEEHFTREDAVVSVGGGVVGDLSGLAASLYMRGITWYNVPTTLLAQVDASVGGKTAVNFMGVKNILGVFYRPKRVLIDVMLLETLTKRQIINGMVEALKMGVIMDENLVELIEYEGVRAIEEIVRRSVELKMQVVNLDEKEQGLRRILNYGHTLGHAFESVYAGELLHGEAVACGMLGVAQGEVRNRLEQIFTSWGLQQRISEIIGVPDERRREALKEALSHDKKTEDDGCNIVLADTIGNSKVVKISLKELRKKVDEWRL